ncbi:pectate lyase [Salegentibacter sp. JZCK2]|uniref:pectate lyase n=1 Tax=Salegentibacter tibetensis TaxID=2873600 RepID=UPI001CCFEBFD|nr:pectate lyase [Salegentibacter tibetensis]MBZ9730104.1 pectate lyase [Salegentibacter tibetensis]
MRLFQIIASEKINCQNVLVFAFIPLFILISGKTNAQNSEQISWEEAQRQEKQWYASQNAKRIADNVLLYQNNNGGWLKNIDMAKRLDSQDKASLEEKKSGKFGTTIDNDATHTQMRYLAKVYDETGDKKYGDAFLKGVDFLLAAQYENGGWPQFYPVREGYYEHITFNDGAMMGVMNLLRDIAFQKEPYDFVDIERRQNAKEAIDKGLEVILKMQVRIDGKGTVWCAQHHREDLSPAKARDYELPSLSGGESVGIIKYLMEIQNPSDEVKMAIRESINWFKEHKITGKKVVFVDAPNLPGGRDRVVVNDPNGDPLWARFNEIGTGRPMFVGRDGIVKDELNEIEHERRMGYSYLKNYAQGLLETDYPAWEGRLIK